MVAVNIKLDDDRVARLDAAVRSGFASNRSDGLRIALDRQLAAWDAQAWERAWQRVGADADDGEFDDWSDAATAGWSELDGSS